MNKHVAKLSLLKSSVRVTLSALLATLLALAGLTAIATPAHALAVDASAASFNFDYAAKATLLSGGANTANGAVVKYTNVTDSTIPGISIDAVVTTALTNSTVTNYDSIGNASNNVNYFQTNGTFSGTYGTQEFTFAFYESGTYTGVGTGIPITLKNVSVTSIDLDGSSNFCQFTDFTGFQSYVLASPTSVNVKTNATDSTIPVGTTRFIGTSCGINDNLSSDAVQVQFDSVTTFKAKFGLSGNSTTNYFGIAFKPLSVLFPSATTTTANNPSNQPPTSSNTTVYATSGAAQILQLADFGNYSDPDSNPFVKVKITTLPTAGTLEKFVNGSWMAVALNDEITVADITSGNLRYTGSADNSLQFRVSDGTTYSTSAYTMSILMASQPQTITFANPGTKTPTSPSFASGATASSGLTVTLTSLTPGVCTVSGLNIVPVAAGQCTIVATQLGSRSYSEAAPVTQAFPITTLTAQTINAPNPGNQTWSGSSYTITRTPTATSGLTVTMISTTPSVCTVSGFVITIVGPGNCTIRNTQAGNGTYGPAPQVEYTFAVNPAASSYTITYDGNTKTSGSVPAVTTGNGSVTLRGNTGTLAKTGYTLTGWNTNADGTGTHYALSGSYNLTADVTLYAEWTAVVYTVTYDGNNNYSGTAPADTTGNGSVTLRGNTGTLARSGYTLTGWNTNTGGTGTHYALSGSYNLTADVTLYAEWTADASYSITYNGNSKTSGTVPSNTTGNGSVTLAANTGTLVRTGYTLTGWNTNAGGTGTHYALSGSYNLTAHVTLYAEWTAIEFTITYDGNSNTSGSAPADTVGYGAVVLTTGHGTLVKTSYTFNGWNTQADGLGTHYASAANYSLLADVTLYAEWSAVNYTITYLDNGKTGGSVPSHTTGHGSVTLANNTGTLVKTGYTLTGWNTNAGGTGTHYDLADGYTLNADVSLYAEWTAVVYTLTFDGNGATTGLAPIALTGFGHKTIPTLGNLVKTNYTFKGWNTAANGSGTRYGAASTYNLTADTTLYAEWALTPQVQYNANGANGGTTPGEIPAGSPVTVDPNTGNLHRSGFRFGGWNTSPNGTGTTYAAGTTPVLPVGTVLYAVWIPTDSLASTGSDFNSLVAYGTGLVGFGLFMNGMSTNRRRRPRRA